MCMEQTTKIIRSKEIHPAPSNCETFAIYNTKFVGCILFEKNTQQKQQQHPMAIAFDTALVAIRFGQ